METTVIAEVPDRTATCCAAWSPLKSQPNVVALATKDHGGAGFESTGGGELELVDLNLTSGGGSAPVSLGSVQLPGEARFATVAWTSYTGSGGQYPMGMIAGGTTDGTVYVYNAAAISDKSSDAVVTTLTNKHGTGPVSALQFSSLNPHQLATGGSSGHVWILDLESGESYTPDNTDAAATEAAGQQVLDDHSVGKRSSVHAGTPSITAVAWNPQVAHIVASSTDEGSVNVWDLSKRTQWCELRAEHAGQAVTDMSWHPKIGLQLLTASGDDRSPTLKLWDLGSTTSMPLTTLQGHQAGMLSLAWNPHDETLLMSCGRDNKTFLWDLLSFKTFAELPNISTEAAQPQQQQQQSSGADPAALFAATSSALNEQKHMRYDVVWSPLVRGVCLTCSFDKKVQVHSVTPLLGISTWGRPPAWMGKRGSAIATGFGGMMLRTTRTAAVEGGAQPLNRIVSIGSIPEHPLLAQKAQQLEADLASQSVTEFCLARRAEAKDTLEEQLWAFMKIIFEANGRQQLLEHLGYNAADISVAASTNGVENMVLDDLKERHHVMNEAAEEIVQNAVVVGDFDAAVECCFQTGNLADALLLASVGGTDSELWRKTQERYVQAEAQKRPYLSIVNAVVHSALDDLVAKSDTKRWRETLAILSRYATSADFPRLCIALGDRLQQAGDPESATLCYVCSLNLERSVQYWTTQLRKANASKGALDLDALHEFIVKVAVFIKASGANIELPNDVTETFLQYAQLLAEQGVLAIAAKYSKGTSEDGKLLRDRLYRSRASQNCFAMLGSAPEFPFSMVSVTKSRQRAPVRQNQASTAHAGAQQSYGQQSNQQQQVHGGYQAQAQQQQQQPYGGQQAYSSAGQQRTQYQVPTKGPAPTRDENELPPGWVAIPDPSSGRTYYANQSTGESTWDRPRAAPAPQPAVQSAPNTATQPIQTQGQATTNGSGRPTTPTSGKHALVSKYGDGFVSSASHPELASQYGNVGTANPYHGTSRPGTAAAVLNQGPDSAPISGTLATVESLELSPELTPVKDTLLAYVSALQQAQLTVAEKRQLSEAEKGVAVLIKKLARGALDDELVAKVNYMVGCISNQDFSNAASAHSQLVNSDWRDQKDWLKGIKVLIQLAGRKI